MIRTVSRPLARSIVVAGPATALDIVHLLDLATRASAALTVPQAASLRALRGSWHSLEEPLEALARPLRLARPSHLAPMQARLRATKIAMATPRHSVGPGLRAAEGAWQEALGPGEGLAGASWGDTVKVEVSGPLAGWARSLTDDGTRTVTFDLDVMREFRCRYAPILWLRALAWMSGSSGREGWTRRKHGSKRTTTMGIPMADLPAALGLDALPAPSLVERQILRPCAADFARAGVEMAWAWRYVPHAPSARDGLTLVLRGDPMRGRVRRPRRAAPAAT